MSKNTTAQNVQKVIKNNLVIVSNVQVEYYETNELKNITPEQFMTDLEFYLKSGIFSDSLDFKYDVTGKEYVQIKVGYMSNYCDHSIRITLRLCGDVAMEQVEKKLRETIFDILSA